MIYTCYSFKGGVGRTMALANIAELLFQRGLQVLMIDFDLEAPGLERYFAVEQAATPYEEILKQRGVIDLLYSYKELRALSRLDPPAEPITGTDGQPTVSLPVEPLANFVVPIYHPNTLSGTLSLLPAGRRWQDDYRRYAERLRGFDWQDFYLNWEGEQFFEWFRREVKDTYHVVLIDSRTGITEMGGICTYQLADAVVAFVATNQENLAGTTMIAESLSNEQIKKARGGREVSLIFAPSRVDNSEGDKLDKFAKLFEDSLGHRFASQLKSETRRFTYLTNPLHPRVCVPRKCRRS